MADADVAVRVREPLARDREAFDRRTREEGEELLAAVRDGTFDNPQTIVGLEYEFYGATAFDADAVATTHLATAYGELFRYARGGLELRGLSRTEAAAYLRPLRARFRRGTPPADWKRRQVRRRLDDAQEFEAAVYGMQREYVRRQSETLLEGTFADWLRDADGGPQSI